MTRFIANRAAVLLVTVLLAASTSSCSQSCTDIGCVDGLEVAFDPPLIANSPLSIELESSVGNHACSSTADNLTPKCDSTDVSLDIIDGEITILRALKYHPSSVLARVTQGGTLVRQATLTPMYAKMQPNGAGCGAECLYARTPLSPLP